jgi:putative hydrolase of the HAD superfamily
MMLQSLLFDLDNTLVDRASAHRRYWEDFLARHPESAYGADATTVLERLIAEDDQGCRPREDYFDLVATALGGMGWEAKTFWNDYRSRISSFVQAQPDVQQLIGFLEPRYQLAVVSNGSSATQRRKLEQAQLSSLFSQVWISEECGCAKPSAKIFLLALEQLECKPQHALFIGDDPIRDIHGAAQVGCRTCWVSNGRRFPTDLKPPDLIIPGVTALPDALEVARANGGPGS